MNLPFKYCSRCGSALVLTHYEGKKRLVCKSCGTVLYENPLPSVVGLNLNERDEILLVRRSIDPGKGIWCLPGGFIEKGETAEEAVIREIKEETNLMAEVEDVIDVCSQINGFYGDVIVIGYEVRVTRGTITPGDDAREVGYFHYKTLPVLAFGCHKRLINSFLSKKGFI